MVEKEHKAMLTFYRAQRHYDRIMGPARKIFNRAMRKETFAYPRLEAARVFEEVLVPARVEFEKAKDEAEKVLGDNWAARP